MPSFLVSFTVYILACLIVAVGSTRRMIGFWGGLAMSVLLTPVAGALILVLTRPRRPKPKPADP